MQFMGFMDCAMVYYGSNIVMKLHKLFQLTLGWERAEEGEVVANGSINHKTTHTHTCYLTDSATYMELPARQNQSFSVRQWDPWWAASIVIIEFAMTVMDFYAFLPSL